MIDDHEIEWLAELDWSMHGDAQHRDVCPKGTIPLATAFERLARHAIDVWPEGHYRFPFLKCAGLKPHSGWVTSDIAFDPEGRPHPSIHAVHAPGVIADAMRLNVPIASTDAVTREEWEDVEATGGEDWAWGTGARRVWSNLAPSFAAAASRGEVKTFARRIHGGPTSAIEPKLWAIGFEMAVRRAASCAICLDGGEDGPFDPNAKPTHRLFVEAIGLEPALQAIARETYVPQLDLGPIAPLLRPIDEKLPSERRLTDRLVLLLESHDPRTTASDEFRTMLETDFVCDIGPRPFRRIWRSANERFLAGRDEDLDYRAAGRKRSRSTSVL